MQKCALWDRCLLDFPLLQRPPNNLVFVLKHTMKKTLTSNEGTDTWINLSPGDNTMTVEAVQSVLCGYYPHEAIIFELNATLEVVERGAKSSSPWLHLVLSLSGRSRKLFVPIKWGWQFNRKLWGLLRCCVCVHACVCVHGEGWCVSLDHDGKQKWSEMRC